jgi:hypothetical protein
VAPIGRVAPIPESAHSTPTFHDILLSVMKNAEDQDRAPSTTVPRSILRTAELTTELAPDPGLPMQLLAAGAAGSFGHGERVLQQMVEDHGSRYAPQGCAVRRREALPASAVTDTQENPVSPAGSDTFFAAADSMGEPVLSNEPRRYCLPEGFAEQVRRWALECASELAQLVESAINRQTFTMEQLLQWRYQELKGSAAEGIRLFNAGTVAAAGFDPPKYATTWDHLLDVEARAILDSYLEKDGRLNAVTVPDVNGYHFTHISQCSRDYTGSPRLDSANRAKEIIDHPNALRVARVGLKGWARVPGRASRLHYLAAGIDPDEDSDPGAVFLQSCSCGRACQLAVPFHVRGRRYGAVVAEFLISQAG